MTGISRSLQQGLAQWLHDTGIGVYKPTGAYTATDNAIVFDEVPATPDRCIVITVYDITPSMWDDTDIAFVQLRYRGTKQQAADTADAARDLLHASGDRTLGGITVSDIRHASSVVLGQDPNKRQERTSNFNVTVSNPNRP